MTVLQLRPTSVGRAAVATTIQGLAQQIEDFLGVELPADFSIPDNQTVRLLEKADMEDLMLERAPFFFVDKAVAIGNETVLGKVNMSAERSAGHFPGRPIVPLIELCKAMAQTGIILASLYAKETEAPIAVRAGESSALTKDLVVAPVDVLIEVKISKQRFKICLVDGIAYIGGQKIGSLDDIMYILLSREQILGVKA